MKKLFWFSAFLSCSSLFAQDNFVRFEANIANRNSDTLYVISGNKLAKMLTFNDGVFKDTLKVDTGLYFVYDGKESTSLYLKNGFDLKLNIDAKSFDETVKYSGKGADVNNFLAESTLRDEKFNFDELFALSSMNEFTKRVDSKFADDISSLKLANLDAEFGVIYQKMLEENKSGYLSFFEGKLKMKEMIGKVSPSFDFENINGGKTKLADLKGKYVYVDVWATWCGPCRQEIPYLQKLEDEVHGKNIEFVSISIDEKKDYEKWKKFVKEKNLGGIQLFADNAWKSNFVIDYQIAGIPRFILIDPKGNIVNADEERPSSPTIASKLTKLLE